MRSLSVLPLIACATTAVPAPDSPREFSEPCATIQDELDRAVCREAVCDSIRDKVGMAVCRQLKELNVDSQGLQSDGSTIACLTGSRGELPENFVQIYARRAARQLLSLIQPSDNDLPTTVDCGLDVYDDAVVVTPCGMTGEMRTDMTSPPRDNWTSCARAWKRGTEPPYVRQMIEQRRRMQSR